MSILVSIFKDFFRHAGNMPLAEMCDRIQSGFYANVINPLRNTLAQGDLLLAEKLKKSLPAFTLSAVYDKRRKDGCIVSYNGLIMLDIDKQEPNAIDDLAALAAELEGTIVTFRSPSGNGLKIGVRPFVDWALTLDRHRDTFNFVKELYESELGVAIDPSGKDKGRLCFVSNDPKLQFFPQRLEGFEGGTLILPPAPTIVTPAAPAVTTPEPEAPAEEAPGEWLSSADVLGRINDCTSLNLPSNANLKVGHALRRMGCEQRKYGGNLQLLVHQKPVEQVNAEKLNPDE